MSVYDWRAEWEEKDSDGDSMLWVIETPDGYAAKYKNVSELYEFTEEGKPMTGGCWLVRRPKPPTYRAWESLAEFVEDGGCEMWFDMSPSNRCTARRVLAFDFNDEAYVDFIDDESFTLNGLFDSFQCSRSPLGPWQPCGRKA